MTSVIRIYGSSEMLVSLAEGYYVSAAGVSKTSLPDESGYPSGSFLWLRTPL